MDRTATGAVALQTERRCSRSTRETAGREREGSAAESIQRTNARWVVPCRVTTMPARWAKAQRTRTLQRKDRRRKTWRHRAPNFSFSQKQRRAGFYSTALARLAVFALPAWNETGRRLAPNRFSSPQQRTRNDSRWRTKNRSRSQPMRSERWLSRQP